MKEGWKVSSKLQSRIYISYLYIKPKETDQLPYLIILVTHLGTATLPFGDRHQPSWQGECIHFKNKIFQILLFVLKNEYHMIKSSRGQTRLAIKRRK